MGLRGKSLLVLATLCCLALILAYGIGHHAVEAIKLHYGTAYARTQTLLNKQYILSPLLRELALSQRLAESELTRQWLLDRDNPEKKALLFREAEHYRQAFADRSYFIIDAASGGYYFNDALKPLSSEPRYFLRPDVSEDQWYFTTLKSAPDFNINVNVDVNLGLTKIWFNIIVKDGTRRIGLAGTGLDISPFLKTFISGTDPGVTTLIVNRDGMIQAHRDPRLIEYSSLTKTRSDKTLYRLLQGAGDAAAAGAALGRLERGESEVETLAVQMDGKPQILAATFLPELGWHVLTAVDLDAARVFDGATFTPLMVGLLAILALLVLAVSIGVDRLLLTPLLRLTEMARAVARGDYRTALTSARRDEIGELTRAFVSMTHQIRSYTEELEEKVRERTRELEAANERMAAANKKINDSIQYASLIQTAILPRMQLARDLPGEHFVLWQPRDVVGGDFYVYRQAEHGCLIGVVDCAGHGVPGAFMTMIAHAALDIAIDDVGLDDPARLLARTDAAVRIMLNSQQDAHLATSMDIGLCHVDFLSRTVTFAGARLSLYWCDGQQVVEIKGERRGIGERRQGSFSNQTVALAAERTFYLTTDGFLDQAGGDKGFSFGNGRFRNLLLRHASLPLAEQQRAFTECLAGYRGDYPQRDDITVLSFRFALPVPASTTGP
ncbi:MAG TPA: biofilm regulation protein phosphatase SiaA [Candidatus Competibacteraceae bacterium]|nr:biofilm regulation protein phosphatase SiaA [Candidatus Competibacteraceae bacterium]